MIEFRDLVLLTLIPVIFTAVLDAESFSFILEPSFGDPQPPPGTFNACYRKSCLSTNQLSDMIFHNCNITLSTSPNAPLSVTEVKSAISECMCGVDAFVRANIISSFKSCASCLKTANKTKIDPSFFEKACSCEDPMPVDALVSMKGNFTCKKRKLEGKVAARVPISETPSPSPSPSPIPKPAPQAQVVSPVYQFPQYPAQQPYPPYVQPVIRQPVVTQPQPPNQQLPPAQRIQPIARQQLQQIDLVGLQNTLAALQQLQLGQQYV